MQPADSRRSTTKSEHHVPFQPEGHPLAGYPFFTDSTSARESWDKLTSGRQARYLRAVPYIQEEYPNEELTVGTIGAIVAVGG